MRGRTADCCGDPRLLAVGWPWSNSQVEKPRYSILLRFPQALMSYVAPWPGSGHVLLARSHCELTNQL